MNANPINPAIHPPVSVAALRIEQAIAQAQSTCQGQGSDSQACELTWDYALDLQVDQFCKRRASGDSNPRSLLGG